MASKSTIYELRRRADGFLACDGTLDLARRWRVDNVRLEVLAIEPEYREFRIPKKKPGTFREIEDPRPKLKTILRKLNRDLQAVYYFQRSPAAYGFLTSPARDPDPRNILTNAQRHIGAKWLMNVDMRDFFHQIETHEVAELFRQSPFSFPKRTAKLLAGLTTYKGRLPMGAPTSPILSNWYAIPLDKTLTEFAHQRGWIYTRYADDITFSSKTTPIKFEDVGTINLLVRGRQLELNHNKTVIYPPDFLEKEVTGLIIGAEQVQLSAEFLTKVQDGLRRLNDVVDAKYLMPSGRLAKTPWVEEIAQQVRGLVSFAQKVLPPADPLGMELENAYADALAPPQSYGPVSWLEFGYLDFRIDTNPDQIK